MEKNQTIKEVNKNVTLVEKITPAVPEKKETVELDYSFLLKQREQIQSDYDRDAQTLATRQAELDQINDLIAKAEAMGAEELKPEPIEPVLKEPLKESSTLESEALPASPAVQ